MAFSCVDYEVLIWSRMMIFLGRENVWRAEMTHKNVDGNKNDVGSILRSLFRGQVLFSTRE